MTRITNAEHVLMLLRAQLERTQRAAKTRTQARESKPGPLQRAQQLARTAGVPEADVARALIAGLLAEEFGPELAVEPRFQTMVEEVREMLDRDDGSRALLNSAVAQLKE